MGKQNIWWVAGIGAIGTLMATMMHQSGQSVSLLLKNQAQLDGYNGLHLSTNENQYYCMPNAKIPSNLEESSIHQLVVCCKAFDIAPLIQNLKPFLADSAMVVLIHNGLGVVEEIKAILPNLRIVVGISTIGAYAERSFRVRAFLDGTLQLGILNGHFFPAEVEHLKTTFEQTKLNTLWQNDIYPLMWKKFALNCAINIFTALYQCKNGDLLQRLDEIRRNTQEITVVLNAYGVEMTQESLFNTIIEVIQKTDGNYSSMYMDTMNGRRTELPYLNVQLIKLAQAKSIATPFSLELLEQFHAQYG
ncbi:ketopantoate reductase family protein [Legionella yabuuchiae]|uniref:ketopantoate reductase family protein n=1 Tax=Legionella yabuuchiae TaxID=376727 RepID=UPI0010561EEF|nr:2-dehydropantoate 2-reductase [Legionella yabuuchiae]